MVHAVGRLARLSHRLVWVSPLAADPRYRPLTRAMAGILPVLDALADGSDLAGAGAAAAQRCRQSRTARAAQARRRFASTAQ